jgi:riboflavin-specific deaminase-like protein
MPSRPHVLVNMAVTVDGKIDTVARRGARISGPADIARVDRLRADAVAVLVGGHTLIGEDPRLTLRDPELVERRLAAGRPAQPTKVAAVSRIDLPGGVAALPPDSRFLEEGGGRVIVHTTTRSGPDAIEWLAGRGAEVIVHAGSRVDLAAMLEQLAARGVDRLLVEGGGTLVAGLLEAGLVDEIQLAVAPLIVGGETAPTPVGGPGRHIDEAVRLRLLSATSGADGDVVLRYGVTAVPAA